MIYTLPFRTLSPRGRPIGEDSPPQSPSPRALILASSRVVTKDQDHVEGHVSVRYGLDKRCERQVIFVPIDPGPSDPSKNKGRLAYTDYVCRKFPTRVTDACETDNAGFCAAWTSAGYLEELAIGFGAIALFAILVGVSSGSRRRRVWRAVSGLILLQGG